MRCYSANTSRAIRTGSTRSRSPEMTVRVEPGDLFDWPGHLAIGFCDTFDTELSPQGLISAASMGSRRCMLESHRSRGAAQYLLIRRF